MTIVIERARSSLTSVFRTIRRRGSAGAALVETVMSVGFLVAIALVVNQLLIPVVVEAFEKISNALSSVGP